MKIIIYSGVILVVIALITAAFVSNSTKKTEQHKYVVLQNLDGIEIRKYAAALYSSVQFPAESYDKNSGKGFRVLASYIFGDNEKKESISMTSPVVMELKDTMKMSFLVPEGYTQENLPKPSNKAIFFEQREEKIIATIAFGGWASDSKIEFYRDSLKQILQKHKLKHTDVFSFYGYNPPFDLVNRRNEVAVELIDFQY